METIIKYPSWGSTQLTDNRLYAISMTKIYLYTSLLLLFISCNHSNNKYEYIERINKIELTPQIEVETRIDSLPIIKEQNKLLIYSDPLFLGFKIGMSTSAYKDRFKSLLRNRTLKNDWGNMYVFYCKSLYNDTIVHEVILDNLNASFHDNKLWKLELGFDNASSYDYLKKLYIEKYGNDYNDHWIKGNLDIYLFLKTNQQYCPSEGYRKSNTNNPDYYYASEMRGKGAPITKEYAFTYIVYKDYLVEKKIAKQNRLKELEEVNKEEALKKEILKKAIKQKEDI